MSSPAPSYVPQRGDIVRLDFDPQAGVEQAGRRPALVLSPREYNAQRGLAIVCPITSQAKGYPFEVAIPPTIGVIGVILADHVKSADWMERRAEFVCKCPKRTTGEVLGKLLALLR